ncbi:hypothetical protein [Micromonospora sediminicola]|uniref:hypothetical protein n=1 Tax=Micromonospora sediminicola TaxID=946078 RepID=UPI0037A7C48C
MNRQPIVNRALILAGLALVYAILAHFGITLPPEIKGRVEDFATIALPLALAYWASRHTTPVSDPRDANGSPLVPAEAADDEADGGAGAGSFSPEAGDATAFLPPTSRP